jgi:beta-glucosidase
MSKRLVLLFLAASIGPSWGQQAPTGERPAYLNPALPIDQRVDDLISRMTVEEKASQFSSTSPAVPRLQIPAYNWWSEALHGVANQGTATVFPQAVGLGATFDEPLILKMATVISTEARAKYHDYERRQQVAASSGASLPGSGGGIRPGPAGLDFWSPNINIFRDPRWAEARRLTGRTHSSPASSALPLFAACRATTRNTSRPSPRPSTTPCTVAPNRRGTPST